VFNFALRVFLDYLIHNFDGWSCVLQVYSQVGSEEPYLDEILRHKKRETDKRDLNLHLMSYFLSPLSILF
jgi:hypothetical protein